MVLFSLVSLAALQGLGCENVTNAVKIPASSSINLPANFSTSVLRPQWLQASLSRRRFHSLLDAAFPGDVHPLAPARRKILDFFPADFYEKASRVHIRLRTYRDSMMREMSLETALSKFAKPGHLLLPIPQPQRVRGKEAPSYYFKPMDKSTFKDRIRAKMNKPKTIDIFPKRDDLLPFEARMVETRLLFKAGAQVQMQIHNEGPKDMEKLRKICRRNIYLRPDVILAAMPTNSGFIIDPQTDYEKVCWVMGGPVKHPERLELVKPFSKAGEHYKRRNEVLRAAMDPGGFNAQHQKEKDDTKSANIGFKRYHGQEQLIKGVPSELDFDGMGDQGGKDADISPTIEAYKKQDIQWESAGLPFTINFEDLHDQKEANAGALSEHNGDEFLYEEPGTDDMFSELEETGPKGNGLEQAGGPLEESTPRVTGTLSLEEEEWEEYKELEVLTGMRPPPG